MNSLTTLIILLTVIHFAVFALMIWIRVQRRTDATKPAVESAQITRCALCGEPATHVGYDGLDPNERRDPHTGRSWSPDMAHYQPLCGAH